MFANLLAQIKGFKYYITLRVLFRRFSENGERLLVSTTKAIINDENNLDKSFQQIFNRIANWIKEGCDREYVNNSIYSPLSESSYIELLAQLKKKKV